MLPGKQVQLGMAAAVPGDRPCQNFLPRCSLPLWPAGSTRALAFGGSNCSQVGMPCLRAVAPAVTIMQPACQYPLIPAPLLPSALQHWHCMLRGRVPAGAARRLDAACGGAEAEGAGRRGPHWSIMIHVSCRMAQTEALRLAQRGNVAQQVAALTGWLGMPSLCAGGTHH